jgi:hypothetical protein
MFKAGAALVACRSLEYTFVVTGPYVDTDVELYLSAASVEAEVSRSFHVKRKKGVLLGDPNGEINLTTMQDDSKLVVTALGHLVEAQNRA